METNSSCGFHLWIPKLELSIPFLYLVIAITTSVLIKWSCIKLISIQTEILVTQFIVYFIAAAIPIYLTFLLKKKIGNDDNHFKRLTIVLASFGNTGIEQFIIPN
jgi:hypothetical protein